MNTISRPTDIFTAVEVDIELTRENFYWRYCGLRLDNRNFYFSRGTLFYAALNRLYGDMRSLLNLAKVYTWMIYYG